MRDILFAALKVAMATLASLFGWLVAVKIISVQLGAAGVGLFGILRQLLQSLQYVTTFSGSTALTQGIASRMGGSQRRFTEGIQFIMILMASGLAVILFFGAPFFAHRLIPHPQAILLLRWLALAALCVTAQTLYTSVLTGHRLLNQLVISQMMGPVTVVLMIIPTVWLVRTGAPAGFVLMLGLPPAMVALTAALAARKAGCLPGLRFGIEWRDASPFFRMSTILFLTSTISSGSNYFIARAVALHLGLGSAGYYWVAWTLSGAYVSLALSSYGSYYLPSLSRLTDREERRSLMKSYLRMALLAMPVLISLVILFKPLVIRILFSQSMLPSLKVMRWMLIGDFFKGISYVLSFSMLAFNEMKWFFWTEVSFALGFAGIGWMLLVAGCGVDWLGILFLILYVCFFIVMVIYAFTTHGFIMNFNEFLKLALGNILIVFLSIITWKQNELHLVPIVVGLGSLAIFILFSLRGVRLGQLMPSKQP